MKVVGIQITSSANGPGGTLEGLSVVKTVAFSLILHRLKGDIKGCLPIQHVV